MKAQDLPDGDVLDWLNGYKQAHSKSDLATLSISAQVLVSELLEEMELMSTQVTSFDIPRVREVLFSLESQLEDTKSDNRIPTSSYGPKLAELLAAISDLTRARSNVESVRARLELDV